MSYTLNIEQRNQLWKTFSLHHTHGNESLAGVSAKRVYLLPSNMVVDIGTMAAWYIVWTEDVFPRLGRAVLICNDMKASMSFSVTMDRLLPSTRTGNVNDYHVNLRGV